MASGGGGVAAFSAMRSERAARVEQDGGAGAAVAQGSASGGAAETRAPAVTASFGDRGTTWWSVQGGAAFTKNNTDVNGRLSLHRFLADDFEAIGSLGGWGHLQSGDDQASAAFDLGFRWHFISRAREFADGSGMTVYGETGIGMLYATGDVPTGGTRYDFTPRAGIGATWPLGDGPSRLDLGVRWQHFSNGSSAGSDDNPSRDAAMVYVGLIFPF